MLCVITLTYVLSMAAQAVQLLATLDLTSCKQVEAWSGEHCTVALA